VAAKSSFCCVGRFQGLGCSPMKVVRELGLERCKTVWSLPAVMLRLRESDPSTRGMEKVDP
jgi:hypothetical protein